MSIYYTVSTSCVSWPYLCVYIVYDGRVVGTGSGTIQLPLAHWLVSSRVTSSHDSTENEKENSDGDI